MIAPRSDRVRRPASGLTLSLWLLAILCAGCDDAKVVACFGDRDFCERVIAANAPPVADAGADQEVTAGDPVLLDGSGSTDPDGHITSYSWTQLSGTTVPLDDAHQAIARFDAPDVKEQEILTFRLTVVDDDRAASEDDVDVTVTPMEVSAIQAGLTLLSRAVAPDPVLVPEACVSTPAVSVPAWFALAGLWMTAHSMALDDVEPNDVTRFLDAARLLLAESSQLRASDPAAKSLWSHGLDALGRFALDRDPALADAAARARPTADGGPALRMLRGEITFALAGDGRLTTVVEDPTSAESHAVTFLRQAACRSRLDPVRLAAATVYLLAQRVDQAPPRGLP